MAKNYLPVRIKNPLSSNHLILLRPNQELIVSLSNAHPGEVKENSTLLGLDRVEYSSKEVAYCFKQLIDLQQWALISSVYLGNIEVVCNNIVSSLCVVVESANPYKKDVITAINPVEQTLKMEPHSVLEIVVYGGGSGDLWDCVIDGTDIKVENIGKREVTIDYIFSQKDYNHVFCAYPRQDFKDLNIREYHYWFRYNKQSVEEIQKLNNGIYPGGRIAFFNHLEETNRLNLMVNVRKKNKDKNYNALYCPNYSYTNCLPAPIPARGPINRRQPSYGPFISDVQLKEIKDCTLESNCRVIDLDCY